MNTHVLPALKLTLLCVLFFVVIYAGIVWSIAQVVAPNHGQGEVVLKNGKIIGFARVGESFRSANYFWPRPSAVEYNAAGSAGSNKGPSNPEYLQTVKFRIDHFLIHNPGIHKQQIPVELVTASGSGLDPDLSPKAVLIQVPRIAKARGISEERLRELVLKNTKTSLLFGPSTVNVLNLNMELDTMK
jgi:K+-transporting ATPase ATPase C chain